MQSAAMRYFLEVARTGSVSAAAQGLRVAGSAVSRQIANLERELDAVLFERRARGMVLTQAGETLAVYARRLELEQQQLFSEIREIGTGRGLIRLAVSEGFAVSVVPHVIHGFRLEHPAVMFDLRVMEGREVTEAVGSGSADIGAAFTLRPPQGVRIEWQSAVPTQAFVTAGHALLEKPGVTLDEIMRWPIATMSNAATVTAVMNSFCSARGIVFEPVLTTTNVTSLLHFCRLGGGIIFASGISLAAAVRDGSIVPLRLSDADLPSRSLQLQTMAGRTLPSIVSGFLTALRAELLKLVACSQSPMP